MDDQTMRFGLLMESAQAHQKLAESQLEKLRAHTADLDSVVRDEIRRTFVAEMQSLTGEVDRAARALQGMKRALQIRGVVWNVVLATCCAAVPSAIVRWALPSAEEIAALRAERAQLQRDVAQLQQRGGRVEWRGCGEAKRLCFRVDRDAPVYGDKADFYVVKGY
jgi:hypothetical protein